MPVVLRTSNELPGAYRRWAAITGTPTMKCDPARAVAGIGAALENAFEAIASDWLELGRELSRHPSSKLAHAPSCAANVSDLGLMLAWTRLVSDWAGARETTLVVCDDPWMFRHLRRFDGVDAGRAPGLLGKTVGLWLRGYAARTRAALRMFRAAQALRFQRTRMNRETAALLVYGHPASNDQGDDGYFGDLMKKLPALQRVLHVDCAVGRARQLAQDGRTYSLHGFGSPGRALALPFSKWRPAATGPNHWLVRRAAVLEGGTGQGAMLAWQAHCHRKWLEIVRPKVVAWPWENHSWERDFVRRAKAAGARTVGYQHSVVGRQMLNYSPGSNADGEANLPDLILTSGQATRDRLQTMGVPTGRMKVGGALRFSDCSEMVGDAQGPVYVALPFDAAVAGQMVAACRVVRRRSFLVKDHPMSPFEFEPGNNLTRTDNRLADEVPTAAVLYAATTVGLEAVLGGLPTLRFRPNDRIAMDILPDAVSVAAVDAGGLPDALKNLKKPGMLSPDSLFAPVVINVWQKALNPDD